MDVEDITKDDVVAWAEGVIDGYYNEYLSQPGDDETRIAQAILKEYKVKLPYHPMKGYKTCRCLTCRCDFEPLGISRHRAMHRDKNEYCEIQYTNGDVYEHDYRLRTI